jgi:hypothetical protein
MYYCKKMILACFVATLFCVQIFSTERGYEKLFSNQDVVSLVRDVVSKSSNVPSSLKVKLEKISAKDSYTLKEDELSEIIIPALNLKTSDDAKEDVIKLQVMHAAIVDELKKYKVTGFSFAVDPNWALIMETQNPAFDVVFKDAAGNAKIRRFQAEINTIGLKLELSIKLDLIFFVNTDLNFYESTETIKLGTGIDANIACLAGLGVTFVPFLNKKGGMAIIGMPLLFAFPSLSVVTGGTLTPVAG